MSTIHLLCGIPASGKSTWALADAERTAGLIISRDVIRFGLLKDGEDYFSKEDEVFKTFVCTINEALKKNIPHIYLDATHISSNSRAKILRYINTNGHDLSVEVFKVDIYTALERNSKREGRCCVPDTAIQNMHNSFTIPSFNEFEFYGFKDITIAVHTPKDR